MVLHTGTILGATTSYHDDGMLLDIMTFSRNIRRDHFPRAQPHPRNLPLARIRFLGLRSTDLQTHTLHLGTVNEGRGAQFTGALRGAAVAEDLDEGAFVGP